MADAINVYHTNPTLYFVPKYSGLGSFNENFGNELYFLEERPATEHKDEVTFGTPDSIESTDKMFKLLRKDEKYQIDEPSYIRTRLFDMLIGDWDRHPDQWRWSKFKRNKKIEFRPIPRDRDQVFSNYDGVIIDMLKWVVPVMRKFQVYSRPLKNPRWINTSAISLDKALLPKSTKSVWIEEARQIQSKITDEVIEDAFSNLPKETLNNTSDQIKKHLKKRRDSIISIAQKYYDYLSKHVIITGTDKDDYFEIIREDNQTTIRVSRIKKDSIKKPYYERSFVGDETKEIWIYGLDDKDIFSEKGNGKHPIKIRLIWRAE